MSSWTRMAPEMTRPRPKPGKIYALLDWTERRMEVSRGGMPVRGGWGVDGGVVPARERRSFPRTRPGRRDFRWRKSPGPAQGRRCKINRARVVLEVRSMERGLLWLRSGRTSLHVYASSAVHSDCDVGFESARITGLCSLSAGDEKSPSGENSRQKKRRRGDFDLVKRGHGLDHLLGECLPHPG